MHCEKLLERMKKDPRRELFAGWSIFDAKECQTMLAEARFRVTFPWLKNEMYRTNLGNFFYKVFGDQSPQMDVMSRIFKTIRLRAEQGKVIFIGRGATYLTQSLHQGIRVRLIAPLSKRIERVVNACHINPPEARLLILRNDRARY